MTEQLQTLKNEIGALRAEIAGLENARTVKAATLTTEQFEAMTAQIDAKRKQLDKVTKAAAKALKLKKPAKI